MGAAKEWGLVLVLGAATFGAAKLLLDGDRAAGGHEAEAVDEVVWAFRDVKVREPGATTVLGQVVSLAPDHDCPKVDWRGMTAEGGLLGLGSGNVSGRLACWSPAMVAVEARFNATPGSEADLLAVGGLLLRTTEDGPFLGEAGYNATRVTVHVFDAAGELVFSNGNASEQVRLKRTLTPEQLPSGVWYLGGNATAPAGTQKPPLAAQAFLPQVRHLIQGLPVGGVATTQTDALATWYGTLFVTLRVDDLVHAP